MCRILTVDQPSYEVINLVSHVKKNIKVIYKYIKLDKLIDGKRQNNTKNKHEINFRAGEEINMKGGKINR